MNENSKATLTIGVTFDDLIALDCVLDLLSDHVKKLEFEDATAVRRWMFTVQKLDAAIDYALQLVKE